MDNVNLTATPELSVGEIVSNGISIGTKQFFPLLLTGILYILTIWIPYLNIGTTIGLQCAIANMSRGKSINPTDIFDPKHRRNIGDFFLLLAFTAAGSIAGLFLYGAGTVIGFAWMLAFPLFADKGTGPLESLRLSNRLTYGNKLNMFLGFLVIGIVLAIAIGIGMLIGTLIHDIIGMLLMFAIALLAFPIILGALSFIYGKLTSNLSDADLGGNDDDLMSTVRVNV